MVLVGVQEAKNKIATSTNTSTVSEETTTSENTSGTTKETTTTTTTTTKTTTTKTTTTLSAAEQKKKEAKEYKKSCKKLKYKKVLRNHEKYMFTRAKWFGEVAQVVDSTSYSTTFRLRVNCSRNRFSSSGYVCQNDIYVNYYGKTRVIEDDMVTVYGEMYGVKTYTTVLGASRTIPEMNAEYITIK